MVAVDQRTSFVRMLKKSHSTVNKSLVREVKKEIIETLAPNASAVLIDPVYCLPFADLVKQHTALLFCLEKSPVKQVKHEKLTQLQKGFSVAKAKKLGADAVKLNLHYNPLSSKKTLTHQRNLVKKVGKDCKKQKIPFLLEIIVYPVNDKLLAFELQKPMLIISAVKEFSKKVYNVNILKLQAIHELKKKRNHNEALFYKQFCKILSAQTLPWVLLSAGVDFKTFSKDLKIAMKNGCSGFLAGRAIWKHALSFKNPKKRLKWIKKIAKSNLKKLNKIVRKTR